MDVFCDEWAARCEHKSSEMWSHSNERKRGECDSHFTSFVFATVSAYESKITCMNTSEILCVMSLGCESNTKLFGHLITNSNTQNHKRFDPHISFPNFVVRDWRKVTDPADHKYPQFVITWKGDSHGFGNFCVHTVTLCDKRQCVIKPWVALCFGVSDQSNSFVFTPVASLFAQNI